MNAPLASDRRRSLLEGPWKAPPLSAPVTPPRWTLSELAGRLVELSGVGPGAALTGALIIVHEAQAGDEPVAWISAALDLFHPPDVASLGVDLAALPVIRTAGPAEAARAAEHLLRSGAFGLVVLDLGFEPEIAMPLQSRLTVAAQKHGTAILCLTGKPASAPSLGSLVSLRGEVSRETTPQGHRCTLRVLKDKRRGPDWKLTWTCEGPEGFLFTGSARGEADRAASRSLRVDGGPGR